jgi:hypothetical protein
MGIDPFELLLTALPKGNTGTVPAEENEYGAMSSDIETLSISGS